MNTAGSTTVNNVALWDGTSWSAFFDGVYNGTDGTVLSLLPDGFGGLYVGGEFSTPTPYISHWAGFVWVDPGNGLNGGVAAIALFKGALVIGGNFTNAGGSGANFVAYLDSIRGWQPLGSSVDNEVLALAADQDSLYVGGVFATAGALGANHVARWDGTAWSALGSGTDTMIRDLSIAPGALYAGGFFLNAGEKPSFYLARWGQYVSFLPVVNR